METSVPVTGRPAGNTATVWLKIIALVFMFIDHSGKMLFPGAAEMRILGRIAFPVYVWCMIVGFRRTRSVPRYLLRILLVGLIAQPFYVLLDNDGYPLEKSYSYDEDISKFIEWLNSGLTHYKNL